MLDTTDECIAGVPAFQRAAVEVRFAPGDVIVREAALDADFYVIARGTVTVSHNDHPATILGPGECFGELALLDPAPRSATIEALTVVDALKVDAAAFAALLENEPAFARAVLVTMATRLPADSLPLRAPLLSLLAAALRRSQSPTGAPVVAPAVAAPAEPSPARTFRREGEYWTIAFDGDVVRLRGAAGLGYIAKLLAHPGDEISALDLETGGTPVPDAHGVGPRLDRRAIAQYRERLGELSAELDEAKSWDDIERATKIETEMQFFLDELSSSVGLGGRARPTASPTERSRVNVTRAIKRTVSKIGEHSPALARHLDAALRTGTFCSYRPDPSALTSWAL